MALSRLILALAAAATGAHAVSKLLLGTTNAIHVLTYDGITLSRSGSLAVNNTQPSWMAFQPPNRVFVSDEWSNNTNLYTVDLNANTFTLVTQVAGCQSSVHLAINRLGTRLVSSCYVGGEVDVYNISNGSFALIATIPTDMDSLGPRQTMARAAMTIEEPSGRFWVTMNYGTDTLIVTDSRADAWQAANRIRTTAGCGPRHGVFYPSGGNTSTHFMVVCENMNMVVVYKLKYTQNSLQFDPVQTMSTYGPNSGAEFATAHAAEILLSADLQNVYVSNTNTSSTVTGTSSDLISVFGVSFNSTTSDLSLQFIQQIGSLGYVPRQMSLGLANNYLVVGNQGGGQNGVAIFARLGNNTILPAGSLNPTALATLAYSPTANTVLGGPDFVLEIAVT